jgi:serine-protein kinase ATM
MVHCDGVHRDVKQTADDGTDAEKLAVYNEVCERFPPVFRMHFLQQYTDPTAWFERRQAYTRSVAVSSIVGYIVGIGDRHQSNILLMDSTAEVVHIDFGVRGRVRVTHKE